MPDEWQVAQYRSPGLSMVVQWSRPLTDADAAILRGLLESAIERSRHCEIKEANGDA